MKTRLSTIMAAALCLGLIGCGDAKNDNKRSSIPYVDIAELDYCARNTYNCGSTPQRFDRFKQEFQARRFAQSHIGQSFRFVNVGSGMAQTKGAQSSGMIAGIMQSIKSFFGGSRQEKAKRSTASEETATSASGVLNLQCPPGVNCGSPLGPPSPIPSRPTNPGMLGLNPPHYINPVCPPGYDCGAPGHPTQFAGGFYRTLGNGGYVTNGEWEGVEDEASILGRMGNMINNVSNRRRVVGSQQTLVTGPRNSQDYFFKNGVHYLKAPTSLGDIWYGISFSVPPFANPVVKRSRTESYKITE